MLNNLSINQLRQVVKKGKPKQKGEAMLAINQRMRKNAQEIIDWCTKPTNFEFLNLLIDSYNAAIKTGKSPIFAVTNLLQYKNIQNTDVATINIVCDWLDTFEDKS